VYSEKTIDSPRWVEWSVDGRVEARGCRLMGQDPPESRSMRGDRIDGALPS